MMGIIIAPMHPLERLINLVALLLETSHPLTLDQIRETLPAYQQDDVASAKRMFERDKDVLREVGIPVELEATDPWEVEQGYRIRKDRYYLPEVTFSAEEVWALFVAAHAPGESGEAEQAFQKLSSGTETNVLTAVADRSPAPGVDASGPSLGAIADALARRRAIRFRYRPSQGKPGVREVDPYSLVFRKGHWYLAGLDRSRREVRSYRLSRMLSGVKEIGAASAPPEGFDASRLLEAGPWGLGAPEERARVAFSPRIAWMAVPQAPGAEVVATREDGWVEVDCPASRGEAFASWVLGFGPDAEVLAPGAIRDDVIARLEALLAHA
jgi:proteasome accessory factor B